MFSLRHLAGSLTHSGSLFFFICKMIIILYTSWNNTEMGSKVHTKFYVLCSDLLHNNYD